MAKGEPKVKIRSLTVSANLKNHGLGGWGRRVMGEIRPALKIAVGNSKLIGAKMVVKGPDEGGFHLDTKQQVFENGAKVLEIHVNPRNARDAIAMINKLLEKLPELKKAGFVGVYGYTPTPSLIKIFKSKAEYIGAIEVGVTDKEVELTKKYFLRRGYPVSQLENAVRGVAIPLGDNIKEKPIVEQQSK